MTTSVATWKQVTLLTKNIAYKENVLLPDGHYSFYVYPL